MTTSRLHWLWQRLASSGFGMGVYRYGSATGLLVLTSGTGVALEPTVGLAVDATTARAAACVGDCDDNGSVTVDEIVTGVKIALGSLSLGECLRFDCNGRGQVTVDCIIEAVSVALNECTQPGDQFVDNGDGTITDTQTGLIWEKKDQGGGLHDANTPFPWAGICTDNNGVPCTGADCEFCQPDAAAASTCSAATGDAMGCAQCSGTAICKPINGLTTVWQWLNQINAAGFAGHSDWRIPTIGRDDGAVQLETIVDTSVSGCGSGVPCVPPAFNTGCVSGCTATSCSCTQAERYWSATSIVGTLPFPSAWGEFFFSGEVVAVDKASAFFVRAVRSTAATAPCGTFLGKFGSQGSGEGQFFDPEAVAVDENRNVFVADSGNHRIEKFTNSGIFLLQWGSMGSAEGQFHTPDGVAVDADGNVFVADLNNNRIEKFDNDGIFLTSWGDAGNGDGQFSGPVGVAIDADGNVLVADRFNNRVQKFTNTGAFLTKWGTVGHGDGQFANPVGVAVDRSLNVYVADFFNDRIQKFTSTGAFLGKWGSTGSGDGQFIGPRAVAVGEAGTVFAVDDAHDRIEVFTATGVFLAAWGSLGNADGQFSSATAVAVDPNGSVLVTDENQRVQRFACSPPPPR
jgi:DNA-binding beta-propeller fold protein YncE